MGTVRCISLKKDPWDVTLKDMQGWRGSTAWTARCSCYLCKQATEQQGSPGPAELCPSPGTDLRPTARREGAQKTLCPAHLAPPLSPFCLCSVPGHPELVSGPTLHNENWSGHHDPGDTRLWLASVDPEASPWTGVGSVPTGRQFPTSPHRSRLLPQRPHFLPGCRNPGLADSCHLDLESGLAVAQSRPFAWESQRGCGT